jgi:[glutamine synthetase] adenylyltransferase / [glutamine synthetase]-adenylyl-L-tyrosine phosphorylase
LTLEATRSACWAQFVASRPADEALPKHPAFAVVAFGKLGGKELGYVSDLDLVFLFDQRADSDQGAAVQRYARFAQRLNLWLTARTTAGALFEIDLRLRPDGAAGLVVSSFEAWSRYERRDDDVGAWTWEHQALTRARFCAGDAALGALFERERLAILGERAPDDARRARLRAEIVAMRKRMHDGHPNRSGAFDLKHDAGGMVDIEFAVQYLVLAFGAVHRELLDNVGNIALLSRAVDAGLIGLSDAVEVADAYRVYRARQHASRLADPQARAARVEPDAYPAERASVRRLWAHLFAEDA